MQCQPQTLEMVDGESPQCFVKLREKVKELKKTLKVPERENVEERQPQIIATASSPKSLAEQRKIIQKQAMTLQHAQKCTSVNKSPFNNKCEQLHCETMKHLLNHMKTCIEDITCPVPLCWSSRQILSHWETCINTMCPLCPPTHSSVGALESQTSVAAPDLTLNSEIANLCQSLYNPQAEFLMQNNPFQFNSYFGLPPSPPGAVETPSSITNIPILSCPNLTHPDPWIKEWHKNVSLSVRNDSIKKLFQELEPNRKAQAVGIEKQIFLRANSRKDYDILLKRSIHKIRLGCAMKKYHEEAKKKALNMVTYNSLATYEDLNSDSFP